MLQLQSRHTNALTSSSKACMCTHRSNAVLSARHVSPAQLLQSKVSVRNRSLALQAHRGDEVAAFLVATDTQEAGAPPAAPPSAVSRQLLVYTTEGARAPVSVLPGLTTVGQLRAMVAHTTRSNPDQVRLSYAGKELPPSADDSLLALKPGIDVVAALQRFQGGGAASA